MNANLVLIKKNGQKAFPLSSNITVIGRRHNCDLRIPLMAVSKKHCQLIFDNGKVEIRDLNSANGIIVNNKKVDESPLKAGDSIKIGPLKFVLQVDGVPGKVKSPPRVAKEKKPTKSKPQVDLLLDDTDQGSGSMELDVLEDEA
ncbi:FHA domain-containing protein [Planctomycetota bacterium]